MNSSSEIRSAYTRDYFLTDCGGYQEYIKFKGRRLADERLVALASVASLRHYGSVLDLGCGRGELAYYFAQMQRPVTAIDYSADAVELAKQTFGQDETFRRYVDLRCEDVTESKLAGEYELAVAADVIEHLSPAELDQMYHNVAQHLSATGLFLVHTFPNVWHYRYHYPRERALAARRGAERPEQPRTPFELQMHINEQNPRQLRRQLAKFFPYVLLWFATTGDMAGSLVRPYRLREMAGARDLFAVAAKRPIDLDRLRSRMRSQPHSPVLLRSVRLKARCPCLVVTRGQEFNLEVEVDNRSPLSLNAYPPNPVNLSYRWLDSRGDTDPRDPLRTPLLPCISPGSRRSLLATVAAPSRSGDYTLRLTLVQEWVRWLDEPQIGLFCSLPVAVTDGIQP